MRFANFLILILIYFNIAVLSEDSQISCPECKEIGTISCKVKNCLNGQVLCSEPCLKKEVGPWIKMKVAGHSDDELWKQFKHPSGGSTYFTQGHLGEKVEVVKGKYQLTGKCQACKGATRIPCTTCNGKPITCPTCNGQKKITKEDLEKYQKAKADELAKEYPVILLKDGTKINGKIKAKSPEKIIVLLPDGKKREILTADLAEQNEGVDKGDKKEDKEEEEK